MCTYLCVIIITFLPQICSHNTHIHTQFCKNLLFPPHRQDTHTLHLHTHSHTQRNAHAHATLAYTYTHTHTHTHTQASPKLAISRSESVAAIARATPKASTSCNNLYGRQISRSLDALLKSGTGEKPVGTPVQRKGRAQQQNTGKSRM